MIIIVGCNKGGAAKSTTAVNLTVGLMQRGYEVVLVDADKQRSTQKWHSYREEENVEPAVFLMEKRDNIASALLALDKKYEIVLVDVAGRNSEELISGASVADILIAPHQGSQVDMDTLEELHYQLKRIWPINPKLKAYAYQAIASTHAKVRPVERQEFLEFVKGFPGLEPLKAMSSYRKVYRDVMSTGRSVLETDNQDAIDEVNKLIDEVMGHGA